MFNYLILLFMGTLSNSSKKFSENTQVSAYQLCKNLHSFSKTSCFYFLLGGIIWTTIGLLLEQFAIITERHFIDVLLVICGFFVLSIWFRCLFSFILDNTNHDMSYPIDTEDDKRKYLISKKLRSASGYSGICALCTLFAWIIIGTICRYNNVITKVFFDDISTIIVAMLILSVELWILFCGTVAINKPEQNL